MSFCDELRKIEWENSYSNKKEEIIHREVEGLITGIKVLSRNAARDGKRNLTDIMINFIGIQQITISNRLSVKRDFRGIQCFLS